MIEKKLVVFWKEIVVGKCKCFLDSDEFYLDFKTNNVRNNIIYSINNNRKFISFYSNKNGISKQLKTVIENNRILFSNSNEYIIYKGNLVPYELIIYKLFPEAIGEHFLKVFFLESKSIGYIPIKMYDNNTLCLPNATVTFDEYGILKEYYGHMNNLIIREN